MIKVKFVSIEEGITALGFRRVAAIARLLNPETEIYFITTGNLYSLLTHFLPSHRSTFTDEDIMVIAEELASCDLLCFSSMTPSAPYVSKIAQQVKKINPKIFILWGGAHCIIYPEDAILHVDAICTGEGEVTYMAFYHAFADDILPRGRSDGVPLPRKAGRVNKKPYLKTPSMWFRVKRKIIKNSNRSLRTPEEMSKSPHLFYDYDCQTYDFKLRTFRPLVKSDYLKYNGLSYRTVWTLGCPYSCIYCANDAYAAIDNNYRKIRYSSVDYILDEIENGVKTYPFVSTIVFYDDNFIAIPEAVLKEFGRKYKKRINLPFVVFGLHPNLITRKKLEILGRAGMNRGRMGIQSGSERTLAFYNRPTPIRNILKTSKILARIAKKYNMIPPSYDVISDNPVETREDVVNSLKLLYGLERPYTLTIFSLRVFPKTRLYDYFKKHPSIDIRRLKSSYLETRMTLDNILLYILATFKPPRVIFFWLLSKVRAYREKQRSYPVLYWLAKSFYLSSRAFEHLRRLDFSTIAGSWGYYFWKMGLIKSRFRGQS